jgi:RimJ/RimL family protein N-acetyltransferase
MTRGFRTLDAGGLAGFCAGLRDAPRQQQRLADSLALGTVRPEWCWTAYDEASGRPLARQHWWGPAGSPAPMVFVPLDQTDPEAAVALLRHALAELHVVEAWSEIIVPVESAGDPWTLRPDAVTLLETTGFVFQVERVRLEWTPDHAIPAATAGLSIEPVDGVGPDDLVELFVAVSDGSLDHSMRTERLRVGPAAEALKRIDFLQRYPGIGGRSVVARDATGQLVGYVAPALANDVGVVAEIGVARPHRGRGYVHDLLAHATRVLAAEGAGRIVADTDCANAPMRAAFARAGYREFARRWDWGWRAATAAADDDAGRTVTSTAVEPGPATTTSERAPADDTTRPPRTTAT